MNKIFLAMNARKATLLVAILLSVFTMFTFTQCGPQSEESLPPNDSPNLLPEAILLEAEKSYSPSNWNDDEIQLEDYQYFSIPASIPVINGQSGNHWVTFVYEAEDGNVVCIYKGNGSKNKSKKGCEKENGNYYDFQYCAMARSYEKNNCNSNPWQADCLNLDISTIPGDKIKGKSFALAVNNGDSCDTTRVEMLLEP